MATIQEVVSRHASALADVPGVVIVGEGKTEDEDCILVMVEAEQYLPEIQAAVPPSLEGYRVVFQVGGVIHAHQGTPDPT